jgi:hypothetical protein
MTNTRHRLLVFSLNWLLHIALYLSSIWSNGMDILSSAQKCIIMHCTELKQEQAGTTSVTRVILDNISNINTCKITFLYFAPTASWTLLAN